MKRTIIIFMLAALVLATCAIWFLTSGVSFEWMGLLQPFVIIFVVVLGLFFGIRRLRSVRRGEPAEDELSKKISVKTASVSYYVSIYLWLAVMYFSDKVQMEVHTMIGTGIIGMAVIYVLCWLFFSYRGIRNE